MQNAEMILTMQKLLSYDKEATTDTCEAYIDVAKDNALRYMYPYGSYENRKIPERYHMVIVQLAVRLFLRRGAEGEQIHNENSIYRTYDNVDDFDLLSKLPCYNAKV